MKYIITTIVLTISSFLFSFNAIGQITATVTPTASACQANGKITIINVQGGTAPYGFALIAGPGVPTPANYQTGNQFTGLQAGDFTISIVDAIGNDKTYTVTVTSTYVIPDYTPVPTLNACATGQQDGKITFANITGGTPPYQTRITQPTAQATAFVTGKLVYDNLPAGLTYEVQLIDVCQNYQTRQVLMPQISYPVLSNATITKTACTIYSVDFSTSGGKSPFTYKVIAPSDGSIGTTNTTGNFNLPYKKNYTVEVTDACGFKSIKAFYVDEVTYIDVQTWGGGGTSCNGAIGSVAVGGNIHVAVFGGLPPFTGTMTSTNCSYLHTLNLNDVGGYYAEWNINDLPRPCSFKYTVTDACGTTQTNQFEMVGPGGANDTNLSTGYEIKCPDMNVNANDTRYRLHAAAWYGPPYSPVGPFTLVVKNASGNQIAGSPFTQNSNEFWLPLIGGTYTFTITDNCGAKSETRTITIPDYVPPTLTIDLTNKCINAGQAKLIATSNTTNVTVDAQNVFKIIAGPDRVDEQNNDGIFSNLISGGKYTFEYYDGCSHVTASVTILPYTQPTFEVSYGAICPPATVSCMQAFNRQGGTNAVKYFYEIIPFGTTGSPSIVAEQLDSLFCNLTVGNYNIRGHDECNNSYIYLGKIAPLTIPTVMAKNHYCVGETIALRATNPIYGAVYTWTQGGIEIYKGIKFIFARPSATAAMSGSYKLKIEIPNAPNCTTESDPYIIKVGVDAEISAVQPTCTGPNPNSDGKIQLILGTVGNKYEYNKTGFGTLPTNISGATGTVSAIPQMIQDNISSPNSAETYYIRVFDENGCSKDISVIINPTTCCVQPTLTIINPSGVCIPSTVNITTSAVITANSGTTTTYWKDAAATQALDANSGPATAIKQNGTYYIKSAANDPNCFVIKPVVVTINVVPTASITGTGNLSCSTTNVIRTASGGGSYLWSNSLETNAVATITTAGTYIVTVTSANGCSATATTVVTTDNTLPTIAITGAQNLSCATSSVTRMASGGGSYVWSNSLGTNAVATMTTAGTYTVTVTSANGCSATATTVVTTDNTLPTIAITGAQNLSCATSSVTRTASGGGSYLWSKSLGTNAVATITTAGTYTVTVTSMNGCSATATTAVTIDNTLPTIAITGAQNLSCATSSVARTASGGGSYLWSNNLGTNAVATMTAAGIYTVTVTSINGCTATATTVVTTDTGVPTVTITATDDTLTCTKTQAILTANPSLTGTFTYLWSNGSTASNLTINDAGTYSVEVIATNGCKGSVSVNIVKFNSVNAKIDVADILCKGSNTGKITVTGLDGISPYQFKLNTSAFQSNNVYNALTAGAYTVAIKDAGGCTSSVSVAVKEPLTAIMLTALPTNIKCNSGNDGQIEIVAQGGVPNYTFTLNGGSAQPTGLFTNLIAGTYTITVVDGNVCSATITTTLTQPTKIAVTAIGTMIDCSTPKGIITATVVGGTPAYQYSIDGTNFQPSNIFANLNGGTYTITVKDLNLCFGTVTAVVTVGDTVKPKFTATTIMVTCTGATPNEDGKIMVSNIVNGTTYQYSVGSTFNASAAIPAMATAIPVTGILSNTLANPTENSQQYTIRIYNNNGCYKDVTIIVMKRVCECKVEICVPYKVIKTKPSK